MPSLSAISEPPPRRLAPEVPRLGLPRDGRGRDAGLGRLLLDHLLDHRAPLVVGHRGPLLGDLRVGDAVVVHGGHVPRWYAASDGRVGSGRPAEDDGDVVGQRLCGLLADAGPLVGLVAVREGRRVADVADRAVRADREVLGARLPLDLGDQTLHLGHDGLGGVEGALHLALAVEVAVELLDQQRAAREGERHGQPGPRLGHALRLELVAGPLERVEVLLEAVAGGAERLGLPALRVAVGDRHQPPPSRPPNRPPVVWSTER